MNPFNMSENPFSNVADTSQQQFQQPQAVQESPFGKTPEIPQASMQNQNIGFTPDQMFSGFSNPQQPFQQQQQQQNQQPFQPQQNQQQQPFQTYNSPIPQQNFNNIDHTPSQQNEERQQQYNIVDMFWLINRKILFNQKTEPNEAHIMTIGFNASFNNLRFGLFNNSNNAINSTSIIIQNATRVSGFNIYSEDAAFLLTYPKNSQPFYIRERQIKSGMSWSPNLTQIIWNPDSILISSKDSNNSTYSFTLVQDQIVAFEKILDFMLNGTAWTFAMMSVLKR